jgi:3-deoxy-7-phosphoheptulonate synthase
MSPTLETADLAEIRPLRPPAVLRARVPLLPRARRLVAEKRRAIGDVVHGRDPDRIIVVVGPCSIHDPQAGLDYARRLQPLASGLRDELVVVMRTYVEKPRSCIGWKGFVNDPDLDGRCDLDAGLERARALLSRIAELGVACGAELLDPLVSRYLIDHLSWGAIGARTVQSQTHRELASSLPLPVGLKNGTDGGLEGARDALVAVGRPHSFVGIDDSGAAAVIRSSGCRDRHLVLRGGSGQPNYGPASVARAAICGRREGIARPVMVDCSHGNSRKDPARQPAVCRSVLRQISRGQSAISGIMLESHLNPGRQEWKPGQPLAYGVSITDACLDWKETETLLCEIAATVAARRRRSARQGGAAACRDRSGRSAGVARPDRAPTSRDDVSSARLQTRPR